MKTAYKHKTGMFGTDAELYVGKLFSLLKNPDGHRRPDLISPPGTFSPRISLEVKSGQSGKAVMVDYQLQYPFTIERDYTNIFGENLEPPKDGDLFGEKGIEIHKTTEDIAYYYDVIGRSKNVSSKMLRSPYSNIQLQWQNQFLVPHEYGFFAFAVSKSLRTGRGLEKTVAGLKDLIKKIYRELQFPLSIGRIVNHGKICMGMIFWQYTMVIKL
jgi:hypothetical protein